MFMDPTRSPSSLCLDMSSFCVSEEPVSESGRCFNRRPVLASVDSNLPDNLAAVEQDQLPLELKRLSDLVMTSEEGSKKPGSRDGGGEDVEEKNSSSNERTSSNRSASLEVSQSMAAPSSADATPASGLAPKDLRNSAQIKEEKDIKRDSALNPYPFHRSSLCSHSSSSSAMKLKTLKNSSELGATIFSGSKGGGASKSAVLCRRLDECAHFHYDAVELKTIELSLVEDNFEDDFSDKWLVIEVLSKDRQWKVRRSYHSLHQMDKQLHDCIFKRKFSMLPELAENLVEEEGHIRSRGKVCTYFDRLSTLPVSRINCGPVLCWMEMDNRGNRVILPDSDSAINIPAVAAAHSIKPYTAQTVDELSLKVGDILSIIDKPPSSKSSWWRGKKDFEVGFFPSDCVELLDSDKIPQSISSRYAVSSQLKHTSSIGRKNKLKSLLMSFFSTRPNRTSLKRSGIVKERLFACDLGEHLLNSSEDVPAILKCCSEVLEVHGIVDGIYRLSGAASTINKLRNEFDGGRIPLLTSDSYIQDIHSISSLLKMYFRELPNPLLTYQLYDKFIEAISEKDEDARPTKVCDVVRQLPPPHYRTAEYLFRHLNKMASQDDVTSMHCKNLAIVWAPNLLRSKELEQMKCGTAALRVVGVQAVVTEYLIRNVAVIFNEENHNAEDGLSADDFSRIKACSLTPTTQKLLTLEEAQERKSQLVTTHLRQQNFIEVGSGSTGLPIKYHTIINLPKDRKKLREKLPSPSRLRLFFKRSHSASFKENAGEATKSASAREKKTSSVGAEIVRKNECAENKRNLSTSALLSNGTPAGDASFGILDDFKRLSTSCEIPAKATEKQAKGGAKKQKTKHRSTSVDITGSEIDALIVSLKEEKEADATMNKEGMQRGKISNKKSAGVVRPTAPPSLSSDSPGNSGPSLRGKPAKSKKSKSQKKKESLLQSHQREKSVFSEYVLINSGGGSVPADVDRLVDQGQLDKPVLPSDDSDVKSDSLETFEFMYADGLNDFVENVLSSNKQINISRSSNDVPVDALKPEVVNLTSANNADAADIPENSELYKSKMGGQLGNCSSNDLLAWSLSSSVSGKDLYKELSPTFNNIWMESGCYGSNKSFTSESKNDNSKADAEQSGTPGIETSAEQTCARDVSVAAESSTLDRKSAERVSSSKDSEKKVFRDDSPQVTDEDLALKICNFHLALNILEQSCEPKSDSSKVGSQPLPNNHAPIQPPPNNHAPIQPPPNNHAPMQPPPYKPSSNQIIDDDDFVFLPVGSNDKKCPKRNSIHCCLEVIPQDRSVVKSTSSAERRNQDAPPSEALSEAALDLFSVDRMYSSDSLSRAKLQISDEDGYVYASYRDLYSNPSNTPEFSTLPKDLAPASASVATLDEEGRILRKLASYSASDRTVMMPVGGAAIKAAQTPTQVESFQSGAVAHPLPSRLEKTPSTKPRDHYSSSSSSHPAGCQALTDPLRRKENTFSSPSSVSCKESFHDKTEFLFRPTSDKNSAFKHHHHRNSTRHFNTPSPEMFQHRTSPSLLQGQSPWSDGFGNSSVRLTSREVKVWHDRALQQQQTKAGVDQKFSKRQLLDGRNQPPVIILNRPAHSLKQDALQSSALQTQSQPRFAGQCVTKNTIENPQQRKSMSTPPHSPRKFSWSQGPPGATHLESTRKSLPAGVNTGICAKNSANSSNIQFMRSFSLDENGEEDQTSLQSSNFQSPQTRIAQSARSAGALPPTKSEMHRGLSESSTGKEAHLPTKFPGTSYNKSIPVPMNCFNSPISKSSQTTVQLLATNLPATRTNQNFVTAKKQLFENSSNC